MRKIRKRHKRRRNAAEYTTWARSTRSRPICGGISASSQCAFIIDRSLSLCKWRKYAAIPMFLHLFLWIYNNKNDSLKFKKSQRDELFAKSDFHESIRLKGERFDLRGIEPFEPSNHCHRTIRRMVRWRLFLRTAKNGKNPTRQIEKKKLKQLKAN